MPNRIGFNIAVMVISIALSLCILEALTRKFAGIPFYTFDNVSPVLDDELKRKFKLFDYEIGFVPGPDWTGIDGMYGCQNGKEYANSAGNMRKNILILGDSVIQSRYLERAFKNILGDKLYRIYNAGVGAYNTLQENIYLKKYIKVKPDILILGFCLNDFSAPFVIVPHQGKQKFAQSYFEPIGSVNPVLFNRFALYRLIKLRTLSITNNLWTAEAVARGKIGVKSALLEIANYCAERNAEFLVIVYPHLCDYRRGEYLFAAREAILDLLKELNIKYIDLHEIYRGIPYEELKQKADDTVHVNEKGHYLAAEEFIRKYSRVLGIEANAVSQGSIMRQKADENAYAN